jgi:hypothetical protein
MHLIGCNLLQSNAKMEVSAKQTSLTSHQIFSSVYMLKNDADVMSEVSAFRSPVAATSNFRSPVTATASDQKKAKRQASDKKKTDTKKLKKQASETAGHSMSLPNGIDDHEDFDDLDYIGRERQHQTAQSSPAWHT